VREYLDTKGELRATEAVVCLARWLEAARGPGPISTRDVQRLYPRYSPESAVAPLRSAADALSSAAAKGLFTRVARPAGGPRAGFYTLTDLGRAVAAALPDQHAVGALRGLKGAAPRRRSRT
jgi:hypothetical protein